MRRLGLVAAAILASTSWAAFAADVSVNFVQGPGGYYNPADRSGPYSIGPSGVVTLLGTASSDARGTGTLNAASTSSSLAVPISGQGIVGFTFSGLTASGAVVTTQISNDGGVTWSPVGTFNAATGVASSTYAADGQTRVDAGGHTNVRVIVTTPGTGTISVAYVASSATSLVANTSPLVPGTNNIGALGATAATGALASTCRIPSSGATTNATLCAAGSHRAYGVSLCNTTTGVNSAMGYVKLFDSATAPVPGTTPVKMAFGVPAGACTQYPIAGSVGAQFVNGLGLALTTGASDSDATATGAGALTQVQVLYQ